MLKKDIGELKPNGQILSNSYLSTILKLKDGSILKIFKPDVIASLKKLGFDTEEKVLDSEYLEHSKEIITPQATIYYPNGVFAGYTMPYIKGISYNERDEKLTRKEHEDLAQFARMHSKVENVLVNNPNIVFPDFCTCDNIIIDKGGNVNFIDYDGLQIGKHKSYSFSSSLGNIQEHEKSKYSQEEMCFTKELDVKSSIYLYFLSTFNVNLSKVGMINPLSGRRITLQEIFAGIKLEDPDLCHKVWLLYQNDKENEFLGNTVFDLAEKYDLKIINQYGNTYHKILSKKK